ncbi:MAG TPA: aminoglycoside phosphotransferase family protein, partial [Dehalococcoidia bacterium]|nr:aminoglycoside phosphotransferase family protein [Dehalococcoidia bacterium]
ATLAVTRILHDRGLVPRIAHPLWTLNGALWTQIGRLPLALYPLLAGQPPPFPLSHALRRELARSIALIHAATPAVAGILPRHDCYEIPDETTLLQGLAAFEQVHAGHRPGLQALQRLLLPRVAEVLAQHARLRALRAVVQNLTSPHVLCHRDLTSNNLLVHERGQLSIVDWDAAALAPPEHDLWVLIGEDFGQLLDAYRQAGGMRELHVEQFEFYLLRRYLGDMLARLAGLLQTETGTDDEELLRGMEAYGFSRWAGLAGTLREIGAALSG